MIVEQLKGEIKVSSELLKGSVFKFKILVEETRDNPFLTIFPLVEKSKGEEVPSSAVRQSPLSEAIH